MKKNDKLKYYFIILIIYCLVFQSFLERYIVAFKYFDEIYSLLSIIVFFLYFKINNDSRIKKNNLSILISLLIIIFTGIFQNVFYRYQPINYVLSDLLVFMKFFLSMYISSKIISVDFIKKYEKSFVKQIKFIILILFIMTIFNYIFNIWPTDMRYGFRSNAVFYGHPTQLASVSIFLISFYVLCSNKFFDKYILLASLLLITTLRAKAIGGLIISIFLLNYARKGKKIKIGKYVAIAFMLFIIFFNRIEYYFTSDGFARTELLRTSIKILKDYFPLGTGFATFGTWYSGVSYSPIYYIYGISGVYGINPLFYSYIADSFWPAIIGQFGFVGLVLFIFILYNIFKNIQLEFSLDNKKLYIAKLICFFYLIVMSFAESSFMGQYAVLLAIIIGISSYKRENKND